ncbi:MAG TPA: hypothetical protein VLB82_00525 [Thermodesulfobacteriota bacterium]|nr:hypothetical protein [Thermodesulfobacteriota bacterium]
MLSKNLTTIGVLLSLLLLIASVPVQKKIEEIRGDYSIISGSLLLSSKTLKKLSLGYNLLIADIYWIRALQYFSDKKFDVNKPQELFKYFDIMTDLDPKFVNAYRFGGTFLAEPPELGLGEVELGVKLLDKGRINNPENFRLVLDEAFIYYLYTDNYKRASELFEEASEKPALSELRRASMKGMAALALSKTGNLELSKKIWKYIYTTSTIEARKNHALKNLKKVETKEIENVLTGALGKYYQDNNKLPENIDALVVSGYIKTVPSDPSGGEFIIVSDTRTIVSTTLSENEYKYAISLLNARSKKFNRIYGRNAENLSELKRFVDNSPINKYPENPYGREFVYDPATGIVE